MLNDRRHIRSKLCNFRETFDAVLKRSNVFTTPIQQRVENHTLCCTSVAKLFQLLFIYDKPLFPFECTIKTIDFDILRMTFATTNCATKNLFPKNTNRTFNIIFDTFR